MNDIERGYRPHFMWVGDPDTGIPFELTKEQRESLIKTFEQAKPKGLPKFKTIVIFGTGGENI